MFFGFGGSVAMAVGEWASVQCAVSVGSWMSVLAQTRQRIQSMEANGEHKRVNVEKGTDARSVAKQRSARAVVSMRQA